MRVRTARALSEVSPKARRDLLVLGALTIIGYLYAIQFDWFDSLIAFLGRHEEWEVDEILAAILICAFATSVFAARRMGESMQNLKERVAAEEETKALALHDALTGLPNRRKLNSELDAALQKIRSGRTAVIAIDLDRFKPVNDLYGHAAGDQVLVAVAALLEEAAGEDGLVARVGGDEFILIWRDLGDADDLLAQLWRLSALFETPMVVADNQIAIGATIGVAVTAPGQLGVATKEMLRRADIALYRAKEQGRGRFAFYEEAMDACVRSRLELERHLRDAVAREAIEPHYQPLVDLESEVTYGYEVLARMRREDGAIVAPDQFIPMAEEIGLIGEMTLSLLRRACRETLGWSGAPLLSVNISPVQLRDNALPQKLLKVLIETGFPAARLQVEITESALVADLKQARAILTSLRNQGVRIALDDFGTGYSSLRHLRELPFDNLKIDRSFVQTMDVSAESQTIVHTILDLARNLQLDVTAEGIETEASAQSLRQLGCRSGQGFWFGRPAAADAIQKRADGARVEQHQHHRGVA